MVLNKRALERAFSPHRAQQKKSNRISLNKNVKVLDLTSSNMRVVVRIRPRNPKELESNVRCITKLTDENNLIFDPKVESEDFFFRGAKQNCRDLLKRENKEIKFNFDKIFGCEASNEAVFEGSTKDIVKSLLDGFNCSVFAYGATGAGKTFTMLGNKSSPGITYLTIVELYKQIAVLEDEKEFELAVSHLEVYNENVQDLIKPSGPLHLREDAHYGVRIPGLSVHRISNADELFNLMAVGNKNRTQHPTDANSESSRSHSVFQLYIRMTNKLNKNMKIVKLSMIDLAGSERGSATGCKGMRFTEGANINKSLLALGNCITSLADGLKHIPYRDSKLTRLLKDSLGGNCQTVMIANVSPSSSSYEDTYNTLKYATRAKKIKQMIKKNVVSIQMSVQQYAKVVESMTSEIEMLRQKVKAYETERSTLPSTSTSSTTVYTTGLPPHEKESLSSLYQEQEVIAKEILKFGKEMKILKWRNHSKRAVAERLSHLYLDPTVLNKRLKRIETSIMHMEGQETGFHEKLKEAVRKYRQHCEKTRNITEQLRKNDNTELNEYIRSCDMQLEIQEKSMQVEHCQQLLSMQQKQLEGQDIVIKEIGSVLKEYYFLLQGSNIITNAMKTQYEDLVRKVEGIKTLTWRTSPLTEDKSYMFNIKNISHISVESTLTDNLCSGQITNIAAKNDRSASSISKYRGKTTPLEMEDQSCNYSLTNYKMDTVKVDNYADEKRAASSTAHTETSNEENKSLEVTFQCEDVDSDENDTQFRLVTDHTDEKRVDSTMTCTVISNEYILPKVTSQYENVESDENITPPRLVTNCTDEKSVGSTMSCTVISNEYTPPKVTFQYDDTESGKNTESRLVPNSTDEKSVDCNMAFTVTSNEECTPPEVTSQFEDVESNQRNDSEAGSGCMDHVLKVEDNPFQHCNIPSNMCIPSVHSNCDLAAEPLNSTFVVYKSPRTFRQQKSVKNRTPSWQKKQRKIPIPVAGEVCNKENSCGFNNLSNQTFIVPKLPALLSSKPIKPGTQIQPKFLIPPRSPLAPNIHTKANSEVRKMLHVKQRQSSAAHPYLPK